MRRPCVYLRWESGIAFVWPALVAGIDRDGFICLEVCWLGLVFGVGTVEVEA